MKKHKKKHISFILIGIFIFGICILLWDAGGSIMSAKFIGSSIAPVHTIPTVTPTPTPTIYAQPLKIPIITYHYIETVHDPNDTTRRKLTINPVTFEKELQTLDAKAYVTYFVKDIPQIFDGKIPYHDHMVILTMDDGYEDFYTVVFPLLKKYNEKATIYIINHFINRKGFLTDKELQEIAASGLVEIGAHTLDHTYLKTTKDDLAIKEISQSKQDLEKRFNIEVETFAYPFGSYNAKTPDFVKQAGFTAAVTTNYGVEQTAGKLFLLSRVRAGFFSGNNITQVLDKMNK